jgi:hypothetical protein
VEWVGARMKEEKKRTRSVEVFVPRQIWGKQEKQWACVTSANAMHWRDADRPVTTTWPSNKQNPRL